MSAKMVGVVSVKPLKNYRLKVLLSDNKAGVFDMSPYLNLGVFAELKEPSYFARAAVEPLFGGVLWPRGQDVSPEKIACEMRPAANRQVRRQLTARPTEKIRGRRK